MPKWAGMCECLFLVLGQCHTAYWWEIISSSSWCVFAIHQIKSWKKWGWIHVADFFWLSVKYCTVNTVISWTWSSLKTCIHPCTICCKILLFICSKWTILVIFFCFGWKIRRVRIAQKIYIILSNLIRMTSLIQAVTIRHLSRFPIG